MGKPVEAEIMRRTPWTACLWPGLAPLWSHGSWWGLALAIAAGVVLDTLLLATFGWSELIGQNLRNIGWAVFAAAWAVAAAWSIRQRRRQACGAGVSPARAAGTAAPQDAFVEAVEHYLKADYNQAERLLGELIRRNARDLEARLMLATLLRRAGRAAEAAAELDGLGRLEGAESWRFEMEEERQLLAEAAAPATAATAA